MFSDWKWGGLIEGELTNSYIVSQLNFEAVVTEIFIYLPSNIIDKTVAYSYVLQILLTPLLCAWPSGGCAKAPSINQTSLSSFH